MNPALITDALSSIDWAPLISGVVTSVAGLYLFLQLRYLVVSVIAYQRARKGKAIEKDHVMLRDENSWEIQKIGFRWVELEREEAVTAKVKRVYTKYIRTKEWADIEVTKVFTEGTV